MQMEMMKDKGRDFPNKGGSKDAILPFEKMKEQRMRERLVRLERIRRAMELRRYTHTHTHTEGLMHTCWSLCLSVIVSCK